MYREKALDLLVVGINGHVLALDPETGNIVWRNEMVMANGGTVELLIRDGLIIASGSSDAIYAIDYRTGETLWWAQHPVAGRAAMLDRDDRLFVAKGGELACFDLTGRQLWAQGLPGMGHGSISLGFPERVRQADVVGS